jgi:hypothetical protein
MIWESAYSRGLLMISNLQKLGLPGLIGLAIGVFLIAYIEPETKAGATVLGLIGVIPSLIIGALIQAIKEKK